MKLSIIVGSHGTICVPWAFMRRADGRNRSESDSPPGATGRRHSCRSSTTSILPGASPEPVDRIKVHVLQPLREFLFVSDKTIPELVLPHRSRCLPVAVEAARG